MTDTLSRLDALKWKFSPADAAARAEMEARIAATGRKRDLITYSDLVRGITFRLPTVNEGSPFQIDTSDWRDLDRAILGDFLGAIASDSFRRAGFFASALVVNQEDRRPSSQFFKWMRAWVSFAEGAAMPRRPSGSTRSRRPTTGTHNQRHRSEP